MTQIQCDSNEVKKSSYLLIASYLQEADANDITYRNVFGERKSVRQVKETLKIQSN